MKGSGECGRPEEEEERGRKEGGGATRDQTGPVHLLDGFRTENKDGGLTEKLVSETETQTVGSQTRHKRTNDNHLVTSRGRHQVRGRSEPMEVRGRGAGRVKNEF